ncbi:hypothetical protein [Candidatus Borrarchaeum sp.]|uniref:hypothetical protein n=1 Tax=Candidatus Borrarchaeum sp. TaxID=2846742 RepID=UPI00257D7460|nr:hypothetical protein [Candidatus Borrarchaeum sp.]
MKVPEPKEWEDDYIFKCDSYKVHIYYKPNNGSDLTVCDICQDQMFHYVLTALNRLRKVFNIKTPFFLVLNQQENVKDENIRADMTIQRYKTTKKKQIFFVLRFPKWKNTIKALIDLGAQILFAHEYTHIVSKDRYTSSDGLTYETAHDKKFMDTFLKLATTLLEVDNELSIQEAKEKGWNEEYGK